MSIEHSGYKGEEHIPPPVEWDLGHVAVQDESPEEVDFFNVSEPSTTDLLESDQDDETPKEHSYDREYQHTSIRAYFIKISRVPRINAHEEVELGKRIQSGALASGRLEEFENNNLVVSAELIEKLVAAKATDD